MECHLGDLAISYETYGSGRPIVMLPGRPSDHGIMERFMEPLFTQRDDWLRIYPDLPGTGRTPAPDRLATHDAMLDTMLAFIDAIIPSQRFVLAGYSYGGYLARGVVSRRTTLIDGLMLCAPQVKADPAQARLPEKTILVEDPLCLSELGPVADMIVVQTPRVVEAVRQVLAEVQLADFPHQEQLEAAGPSSFEVAPPVPFDGPTLIITARQDQVVGYRAAWDLLDTYRRATFSVLDRAGHFVPIEQDALCHALMREWLDRVEEAINT
ncbi:MAG TPA: alpha/beta hydrolase [Ktedonobacteraceae bacterium]|nr:alpha/beta hydrolase [Ktedonobacteraceae bacterium]